MRKTELNPAEKRVSDSRGSVCPCAELCGGPGLGFWGSSAVSCQAVLLEGASLWAQPCSDSQEFLSAWKQQLPLPMEKGWNDFKIACKPNWDS